jgi:hypothetical protein
MEPELPESFFRTNRCPVAGGLDGLGNSFASIRFETVMRQAGQNNCGCTARASRAPLPEAALLRCSSGKLIQLAASGSRNPTQQNKEYA